MNLKELIERERERRSREHEAWVADGGPERLLAKAEEDRQARVLVGWEDEEGNSLLPPDEDDDGAEDETVEPEEF